MNSYDVGLGMVDALYLTASRARQAGDDAAVSRFHHLISCVKSDLVYAGTAYKTACLSGRNDEQRVMAALISALLERCPR